MIRSNRPLEIVLAFGETPLPNECHIRNISLSDLTLFSNLGIRILGFVDEHIKNVSLSNISLTHSSGTPAYNRKRRRRYRR